MFIDKIAKDAIQYVWHFMILGVIQFWAIAKNVGYKAWTLL